MSESYDWSRVEQKAEKIKKAILKMLAKSDMHKTFEIRDCQILYLDETIKIDFLPAKDLEGDWFHFYSFTIFVHSRKTMGKLEGQRIGELYIQGSFSIPSEHCSKIAKTIEDYLFLESLDQ